MILEITPAWAVSAIVAFAICAAVMRPLIAVLRQKSILDVPNERSSHAVPTPRGGGIAVLAGLGGGLATAWIMDVPFHADLYGVIGAAAFLAALSFVDGQWELPPWLRLVAHVAAVTFVLWQSPDLHRPIIGMFSAEVEVVLTALAWVWWINLFNFMDGIDGISGVETISICCGLLVLASLGFGVQDALPIALMMAAAMAAFLIWNWSPAKIFLGDVGSVPIGFVLGWLLLISSSGIGVAAAMIIAGYYAADATVTLIKRGLRKQPVWHPHKEHYYQRAVQNGRSHAWTSIIVLGLNVILIGLSVVAVSGHKAVAAALAVASVIGVFILFSRRAIDPTGEE